VSLTLSRRTSLPGLHDRWVTRKWGVNSPCGRCQLSLFADALVDEI
jgi:hypothetical protein